MDSFDPKLEIMGVIQKETHIWLLMELKLPNYEESVSLDLSILKKKEISKVLLLGDKWEIQEKLHSLPQTLIHD